VEADVTGYDNVRCDMLLLTSTFAFVSENKCDRIETLTLFAERSQFAVNYFLDDLA